MRRLHFLFALTCEVSLLAATGRAAGVAFTLVDGATDWTAAASYKDATSAPGADDVVIVPAAATVRLNASTDAASLALVQRLRNIYFTSDNSCLEIKVDGTDEVEIPVAMSAYKYDGKKISGIVDFTGGPIVKLGTGTLHLSSCGFYNSAYTVYDYYSSIHVKEGTLKVLYGYSGLTQCALGRVTVDAGATFFAPHAALRADGGSNNIMSFAGAGIVTSDVKTVIYFQGLRSRGDTATFSGSFGGPLLLCFTSGGDAQNLTGRSVTSYEDSGSLKFSGGGRVGFGNLATAKNMATAFGWYKDGTLVWAGEDGFTFEYVGSDAFETIQGFVFRAPGTAPVVFDAGAHGGITFKGQWQRHYSSTGGVQVVLTGSNEVACVLNNILSDNTLSSHAAGVGHTLYLVKEGTGTWFIKNLPTATSDRRAFASGISVNEGILQYDALAEKGEICALGVGTNLTDGTIGTADTNAEHRVDYGVRFGAPTLSGARKTSGRLEYVNEQKDAVTTTREFALDGEGGFVANSTTSVVVYAGGVYGISSDPTTLHLGGTSTTENVVMDISDGASALSVVKEDSGTWALGGNLTFTGDITVKGGTLILRKPSYYSWYRWTVTGVYGSTDKDLQYYELGYFDKDGNNQVLDTAECTNAHRRLSSGAASRNEYLALRPGTAQHHLNGTLTPADGAGGSVGRKLTLDRAFDGLYSGVGVWGVRYGLAAAPTQENSDSWVPLTVRLRDDATEIAGFDFANVGGTWNASGCTKCISNCTVEASLDGLHWDTLTNMTAAARHYDGGMWSCQGGYEDGEETHSSSKRFTDSFPNRNPHYNAYPLTGHPATLPTVSDPTGFVSVSGGGRLTIDRAGGGTGVTISRLRVDGAGTGTIDGFTFAESGTLDVPNYRSYEQGATLPLAFTNVTGLANLANWTLTAGSRTVLSRRIKITPDGKLTLVPFGLMLIVR